MLMIFSSKAYHFSRLAINCPRPHSRPVLISAPPGKVHIYPIVATEKFRLEEGESRGWTWASFRIQAASMGASLEWGTDSEEADEMYER